MTFDTEPTYATCFTGIGGFDLGLDRAGFHPLWMCENHIYARRVLEKRYPGLPLYGDIKGLDESSLLRPTVLAGGFPCQDISEANPIAAGIRGGKSGLWFEFHRVISHLRPDYVLVENVSAIRKRGLATVLAGLAEVGYDAEWDTLRAADFGAPHERARVFLIAYRPSASLPGPRFFTESARDEVGRACHDYGYVADTLSTRQQKHIPRVESVQTPLQCPPQRDGSLVLGGGWGVEPDVGRVAHGVPHRVDRLRALGNALTPVIAEWIAHLILRDMDSVRRVT